LTFTFSVYILAVRSTLVYSTPYHENFSLDCSAWVNLASFDKLDYYAPFIFNLLVGLLG
jgi:hypothetical protein